MMYDESSVDDFAHTILKSLSTQHDAFHKVGWTDFAPIRPLSEPSVWKNLIMSPNRVRGTEFGKVTLKLTNKWCVLELQTKLQVRLL